jgi:hypothetical protein
MGVLVGVFEGVTCVGTAVVGIAVAGLGVAEGVTGVGVMGVGEGVTGVGVLVGVLMVGVVLFVGEFRYI